MSDELTTTPEESQVETSQVSDQEVQVDQVEAPEEVSEQPTESHEEQQTLEQKPTRAEKRLHQLLSKPRPQPEVDPYLELMSQMPEITPDEDGNISQDQLSQLVAAETAKTLKVYQENQNYRSQVETFTSEVEEVGSLIEQDFKDPKVAAKINSILTRNLEAANLRTDQYGNPVLVPVLSAKEAYNELKETLSLASSQGQAQATATMAQQIAEGAVTPSNRQSEPEDMTHLSAAEIFKNPTAVREALEAKLR